MLKAVERFKESTIFFQTIVRDDKEGARFISIEIPLKEILVECKASK